MIARIIEWSARNVLLVLFATSLPWLQMVAHADRRHP